jgi:uncharacterized protein (TIGR02246 family)
MNTPASDSLAAKLAALAAASILTIAFLVMGAAAPAQAATADTRAAIAAQSRSFMDATERGDARAVAELFTADAKLIVPGVDGVVAGRSAIESFWQAGFSNGVAGLRLTTLDLDAEGSMLIETGTYQALGRGGSDLGRGHYLFVWKKEKGAWKIHRDIANSKPAQVSASAAATGAADRVGFPRDYRSALKLLGVAVKDQEPSVMSAYGNDRATSITASTQLPYPYGTVIAMEFAHGMRDGEGQLLRDPKGTPLMADVARIDVMRRERGYGEGYGENRAGEWEFASYRPDGTTLVAPEYAGACAACHRKAGVERDFVYKLRVPGP